MGRYRSRSRSRSYSPRRSKRYDEPRPRRERRSPPPCGLLVRNLPLDASPEDLRAPFEKFGPIKDIYLPKNYYTGEPRGFGFVKFRHPEDAAEAKEHLNYKVLGGREMKIVYAEENRRIPREVHGVSRTRGSYRQRSPVRSSQHRYRSPSRSPSPARNDPRDRRRRDDRYYSSHRSVSRSLSPRDEREYQSDRMPLERPRSISRSPPRGHKKYRSSHRSASPTGDGRARDEGFDEPDRLPSVKGKEHTFSRSLISPSPRFRDNRSPSPGEKVISPLRSPSPRGNGHRSHHDRYGEPDKSPSSRGIHNPARSLSRSYRSPRYDKKKYKLGHRSPSPSGDGRARDEGYDEPDMSPSVKGKRHTLSRSHRSPSPRWNDERSRDVRSPSPREKVFSPLRSPRPSGSGRRSPHDSYGEPDKSSSLRGKVRGPPSPRSRSYSPC